jgi:hypothetical protein
MKKILIAALLILSQGIFGQSITVLPSGLQNFTIKNSSGIGFENVFATGSLGTYLTSSSAYFQTNTISSFNIGPVDEGHFGLSFLTNGNVVFNNFLKMGSDAPAIAMLNFTGTTDPVSGNYSFVDTYVLLANVLSASLIVDCGAAGYVPQGYNFTNGYLVELGIANNGIFVRNVAGKSANILNKPFKLILTVKN